MVERTISVREDLFALAADLFKLRHKPLEIVRWQNRARFALVPLRPNCLRANSKIPRLRRGLKLARRLEAGNT